MESSSQHEREVRAARNQSMFRAVNEKLRALNETFAVLTDTFAVACECYDTSCLETIDIRSEDYLKVRAEPRRFVVRPGHLLPELEHVVQESDHYVIVEKTDAAGDVAELLDPPTAADAGRRR
jgi:hypothetical protein